MQLFLTDKLLCIEKFKLNNRCTDVCIVISLHLLQSQARKRVVLKEIEANWKFTRLMKRCKVWAKKLNWIESVACSLTIPVEGGCWVTAVYVGKVSIYNNPELQSDNFIQQNIFT